jgi:hypothetical protein
MAQAGQRRTVRILDHLRIGLHLASASSSAAGVPDHPSLAAFLRVRTRRLHP